MKGHSSSISQIGSASKSAPSGSEPAGADGFGQTILSARDFEAFTRQVEDAGPNPTAEASVARGMAMMEEYRKTGSVKITAHRTPGFSRETVK